jgi:hypothetical protein
MTLPDRAWVLLTALVILGATSDASAVFDCLPPQNCRNVAECCKPFRDEFRLQVARAEMRRDFYRSKQNRDDAFAKGAWSSTNEMERAFVEFIQNNQDVKAKARLKIKSNQTFDDVPTLTTGDDCKTTIDASGAQVKITDIPGIFDDPNNPLTKANVCKEAVAAAIHHESEHQDRCEAKKAGYLPPGKKEEGWARRELEEYADDEANGYAAEAWVLRRWARQARQRCTTAKKLAAGDFDNAKQRLRALKLMRQPRSW